MITEEVASLEGALQSAEALPCGCLKDDGLIILLGPECQEHTEIEKQFILIEE